MSPRTEEDSGSELHRIIHMQTMEEMAQELESQNLSTQGSKQDLHQRLLRFHLNKRFPNMAHMPLDLGYYGGRSEIMFKLTSDKGFDRVTVSNEGKTIQVNMKPDEVKRTCDDGKTECETCKIYFQNPTDSNSKKEESESDKEDRSDYQLCCLNLLRTWILGNPYMKDETAKDFLGNLADFRKFAKIDEEMLLTMLPCVLWPSIKSWYRTQNFNSWQEFESSFLEAYGSNPINPPKSLDSGTQTTASPGVSTNEQPNKTRDLDHEIIDKLSAVSVSQTSHSKTEPNQKQSEQESRWECVRKLKLLDLKFAGQKGLAAVMFMDDLNDFRGYAEVSDRVLLEVLPSILDNDTKTWYRAGKFSTWQDFEKAFVAGYKFNSASSAISKSAILSAPLSNSYSLKAASRNSMNLKPPTTQKSSTASQSNYANSPVSSALVSSQSHLAPNYSTNVYSACVSRCCQIGSGCYDALPPTSQSNYSSTQPSYAYTTNVSAPKGSLNTLGRKTYVETFETDPFESGMTVTYTNPAFC